ALEPWFQSRGKTDVDRQQKGQEQQMGTHERFLSGSMDGFSSEQQTGGAEEQRGVGCGVAQPGQPNQPRDRSPIMDDQIADVEDLDVRQSEIQPVNDGLEGFI